MMDLSRRRPAAKRDRDDILDLNLRSLDIFVQVVESGGISPAARRMGLTQSAVSQIIAGLEQSLGVQLFDRNVRPIATTPSGSILLDKARGVLNGARDAIQAARHPAATALPKINICLVETVAGTIGLDLVSNIQNYATLWSVHGGLHSHHSQSLLTREVDIVVSPDALEDEPNLERHLILKEQLCIVLPRDFKGEVRSLAALAETRDLVRLSARTMLGRQVERHLRRLRIEAKGRVEFDDPEAVMAMVAANRGWALLTPLCVLLGRSLWPSLRLMPMPAPGLSREVFVIAREKELGEIPRRIAGTAVASIDQLFTAELFPSHPWMSQGCFLPGIVRKEPVKAGAQPSAFSIPRLPSLDSIPLGKLAHSS
jgi:DNA-binding transcriptional LysR family regulator